MNATETKTEWQTLKVTFLDGGYSYYEVRKGFNRQDELRRQLGNDPMQVIKNIEVCK